MQLKQQKTLAKIIGRWMTIMSCKFKINLHKIMKENHKTNQKHKSIILEIGHILAKFKKVCPFMIIQIYKAKSVCNNNINSKIQKTLIQNSNKFNTVKMCRKLENFYSKIKAQMMHTIK